MAPPHKEPDDQPLYDDTTGADIYDDTTAGDIYDDTMEPQELYQDTAQAPTSSVVEQQYTEEEYDDVNPTPVSSAVPQGYSEEMYDDSKVGGQMSPPPTSPDLGLCARALYDYEASKYKFFASRK